MRSCYETRNFAGLMGLIEEAQSLANRMEGALNEWNDTEYKMDDVHSMTKKRRELKRELSKMNIERNTLAQQIDELEDQLKKIKHAVVKAEHNG